MKQTLGSNPTMILFGFKFVAAAFAAAVSPKKDNSSFQQIGLLFIVLFLLPAKISIKKAIIKKAIAKVMVV